MNIPRQFLWLGDEATNSCELNKQKMPHLNHFQQFSWYISCRRKEQNFFLLDNISKNIFWSFHSQTNSTEFHSKSMTSFHSLWFILVRKMCTMLFVFVFAKKQRKFIHLISTRLFGNQSDFLWWWWRNGLSVLTRSLFSWFHAQSCIFYLFPVYIYIDILYVCPVFFNSCQLSTSSRWVFVWLSRMYLFAEMQMRA